MRQSRMPVTPADHADWRPQAWQGAVPQVAAAVALLVLVWALTDGFSPAWPLWTIGILLGLGLVAGALAQLAAAPAVRRFAQPVAAVAALFVLAFWLPAAHSHWAVSPAWIVALCLGLGLVAGPLAQRASGQPLRPSAPSIVAVAAMLLLMWELSMDGVFFYTASPGTLHSDDQLPVGVLRVVIMLLCLGLAAGQSTSRQATRRFLQPLTTVASLVVLLLTLVASAAGGIRPVWPLLWAAALLGLGLLPGLLAWLASRPREKVLFARVNELSRTRSGALDVQATELRRIERDLHDGAQVRLVALSLKLGRAEDRYRHDPETAALLREAREDATAAIRELRELARGIAPPVLADRGLDAAVRSLAQRSGAEVTVTGKLERRPLPAVETAAYFVVAESLTNAAKHAPGAQVEIRINELGRDLFVEITDFGPGGADQHGGGLTGLRQRVEALDGVLKVTSPAGVGTQVEAVMPCEP